MIVDSRVANLAYLTDISGLFGRTDATGHFQYRPGDKVKFFLDDPPAGSKPTKRPLGPAAGVDGAPEITALQLFGVADRTATEVRNLARLLGTLAGGLPPNPGTPIQLPQQLPASLPTTLPSFSSPTFDTAIQPNFPLTVTVQEADAHLSASLPTVTVSFVGPGSGTVTATPTGTSPGISNCGTPPCKATFESGTSVTLTATSNAFGGWSAGTGNATCGNATPTCSFTVTQDSSITATFNIPQPPQLTITKAGTGTGVVTCSTDGGTTFTPCAATYSGGTALILKAMADTTSPPGSSFVNWTTGSGNATVCTNSPSPTCSFTLNADSAVTANFVLNPVNATFSAVTNLLNGSDGSVACSTTGQGGPFAPCAANYPSGTALTLQASSTKGNFTGWNGGTGNAVVCNASTNPICSFTLTQNSTVMANFSRPTLSVVLNGNGSVSSTPAGVNCNPTCSAFFDKGTPVTLTASGAGFTGWTNGTNNASGCSGTGTCQVTLNVDSSITASFTQVSTLPNFKFIGAYGNQLLAINPASPGSPTPVKIGGNIVTMPATNNGNGGSPAGTISSASFNAGPPAQFTGMQDNTIIFPANGHIYRASTLVSAGVPGNGTNEPVQVSSAAAGLVIGGRTLHTPGMCGVGSALDPIGSNPPMGYNDPGVDGLCNTSDDFLVIMHLNDPSTMPPVTLAPGTTINDNPEAYNLTNGQLLQVLLTTATGDLQWMDNNFSPANVANGAGIGDVAIVARQTDKMFLLTSTNLYIYTPSTHTLALPAVVTADPGQTWFPNSDPPADGNAVFLVQTDGKMFRVPLTTAPGATITAKHFTPPTAMTVAWVLSTPNKIILETGASPINNFACATANTCNNGLIAVDKTAPNTSVVIEPATTAKVISPPRSFNNHVLYSVFGQNVSPTGAFARIEDASAPATLFSPSGNWSNGVLTGTLGLSGNVQTMLRAILVVNTGQQANGALVQKLDSPTGTPVTLGTVSDPTNLLQFAPFFFESMDSGLLGFSTLQANPANTQPFFVDTAVVGSLTKIPVPAAAPWVELTD